jgi:7-cyano-7-deazaguanine synthase
VRQSNDQPRTGLLLSGGIDSAVLLDQLLNRGWQVVPFYVRTGCIWQDCELAASKRFLAKMARLELSQLVVLDMPLADLYGNHWSISGANVPDASTPDEAVYLLGRNPLLLIKPALWCRMHGIEHLALATLAANPFRDATPAFFACFEAMFQEAVDGRIQIARPLERMSKIDVLNLASTLPLELTFSCLSPIADLHCGRCNKCAERRRGFREAGLADRTQYAATTELAIPIAPRDGRAAH